MSQWYYTRNRQQNGPVSFDELKQIAATGGLTPSDMVWNPPMPDWIPASSVQGLFNSSNPYATPPTSITGDPEALGTREAPMEIEPGSQPIDVGACISRGFQLTNRQIGVTLLSALVLFAVYYGFTIILNAVHVIIYGVAPPAQINPNSSPDDIFRHMMDQQKAMLWQIPFNFAVSTFLNLGMVAVALNIVSGRRASVVQVFSQGGKFLRALGATILFSIAVYIGFLLLIIPGIWIILRFGFFQPAIVDKNLGIVDSFKYSFALTKNSTLSLLGLGLLCAVISFVGLLACCVGILYAYPVALLSWVVAYRWLQYGRRIVQDQPGTQEPLLKI